MSEGKRETSTKQSLLLVSKDFTEDEFMSRVSHEDSKSFDISFDIKSHHNIDYSMEGEQLKERLRDVQHLIMKNEATCLKLCPQKETLDSLKLEVGKVFGEQIQKEDFTKLTAKIQDKCKDLNQADANELLFALCKTYYLSQEQRKCVDSIQR